MEAMSLGYPPERAGQISVTATKEEWREVMVSLMLSPRVDIDGDAASVLAYWLINQGVYE